MGRTACTLAAVMWAALVAFAGAAWPARAAQVQPSRPGRGSRRRPVGVAAADGFRRRRRPRPGRQLPRQALQRRLFLRERQRATRRRTSCRSSSRRAASARGCRTSRSATWTASRACSRPATEYPDFLKTGLENGTKLPLPANIHPEQGPREHVALRGLRRRRRSSTSIVGVGDWTDYGWDNAYDASGKWTNGPLRGFVYFVRNTGTTAKPEYDKPVKVMAGDKPVETFGWPSPNFADFDGDGDLDLLCGEFLDGFTYFENIGTRTAAEVRAGQAAEDRRRQAADDGPGDDHADRDRLGQGRRPRSDRRRRRRPRGVRREHRQARPPTARRSFSPPRYFQQEADDVKCGALATPVGFDWDGDGDIDIVSGNTAGYIVFFENLSGPGVEKPKWAAPKLSRSRRQSRSASWPARTAASRARARRSGATRR